LSHAALEAPPLKRRPARALRASLCLLAALVLGPASVRPAAAQAGLQPIPAYDSPVVDTVGLLAADGKARLVARLTDLQARKGSQVAVLIVPTTQPEEIEQYSIRVADAWQTGRKGVDDGAILLIAAQDRRMRIEVGRGLEGALTDLVSNRIIDETVRPAFRAGEFSAGIEAGVGRMIGVIDGEQLPPPDPRWSGDDRATTPWAVIAVLGGMLLAAIVVSIAKGRAIQALSTSGVMGVMAMLATGSLAIALMAALFGVMFGLDTRGVRRGTYYSPGRHGSWGSHRGGGFGGGGFGGGGGGGFGGGGASGRW
jgi:uncharacterized protein